MEPDKYTIIISDRAKRMIGEHIAFLAKVDKKAATAKRKEIIAQIKKLDTMPERFPFLNENYLPSNKYHKMFIRSWYIVLYQVKDNKVYIDYVLDCREDYQWMLR